MRRDSGFSIRDSGKNIFRYIAVAILSLFIINNAFANSPNPESPIPNPDTTAALNRIIASDMPASYRLITSHPDGWLNTSRPLTAEDLQGRVILLDFWTYCCINCMHVIPDLKYLEEKFGSSLTVIGIHSAKFTNEKDSANIREAIIRYGIHHPVVNDADFSIWNGFGVNAWPTFVLINPKGTVESTYSGEGNRDALESDIAGLLKMYDGKINTSALPISLEANKQPPSVLSFPGKLAYAPDFRGKPALIVSDSGHNRLLAVGLDGGVLATIGSGREGFVDGDFSVAEFSHPQGILMAFPYLYIADTGNHALRQADFVTGEVTTLAGTGQQGYQRAVQGKPALKTPLSSPWDLAFYPDSDHIAIAMAGLHQLWSYNLDNRTVSVIAGNGRESIDDGRYPNNSLAQPSGLSAAAGKLYFVDAETSSLRVLANGQVSTLIGTGLFDFGYKEGRQGTARLQHPLGLYANASDVYIADAYNHSIRHFDPATGMLTNFAGHGVRGDKDGALDKAEFNEPNDVLLAGNKLYVADTNNNAIRIIDLDRKTVSTLAVKAPQPAAAASGSGAPEFSDRLPNLEKMRPEDVPEHTPLAVVITLHKGWHINPDAPSILALFNARRKPIASFDQTALKNRKITLPKLSKGAYRLQATLYYCEDKAGSQCLIKSFDITLKARKKGIKEVVLKLH